MLLLKRIWIGLILAVLGMTGAFAQQDMPGSSDHPVFPRPFDGVIATYTEIPQGSIYLRQVDSGLTDEYREGETTKIFYLLPSDVTPDEAFDFYFEDFVTSGRFDFEAYYGCNKGSCPRNVLEKIHWPALISERVPEPTKLDHPIITLPDFILRYPSWQKESGYLSGVAKNSSGSYLVSVYIAKSSRTVSIFNKDQTFVDLQIIEIE